MELAWIKPHTIIYIIRCDIFDSYSATTDDSIFITTSTMVYYCCYNRHRLPFIDQCDYNLVNAALIIVETFTVVSQSQLTLGKGDNLIITLSWIRSYPDCTETNDIRWPFGYYK